MPAGLSSAERDLDVVDEPGPAEMGGLLAIWMGISYVGSQTLLPVLILTFKPGFIMREIPKEVADEKARLAKASRS